VDARLEGVRAGKFGEVVRRSEELHARLWDHATAVGREDPHSVVAGLFIASLNEVIDLHTKRLMLGARNRIPAAIWAALYLVAILGTAVLGYHSGLAGSGRSLALFALVLSFSAVMTLIADLDRPQQGMLRVSQQALVDLRSSMEARRRP
jgi:hypothetical protein